MRASKRCLPFAVFVLLATPPSWSATAAVRKTSAAPPSAELQAGDLLWPKKPGDVILFNAEPGKADKDDAVLWRQERDAYLETLRKASNPTPEERERYVALQSMTYEEFSARYLDDRSPGEPATFGTGDPYVGHVAIVDLENGKPVVIEAVLKGVRRIAYADWLRERSGDLIWWARLKGVPRDRRAAVAKAAAANVGKPYDFWDFNLLDTTGFYCSKLAWYSIWTGAGISPDDDTNPKRVLWYSPKRLMRSPHVELLANPGSYESRDKVKESPR
jgi:hypothetical protein